MASADADQKYARYFLVDYENVNRDGMNGIVKLAAEDCVRIYYSEAAATLTFGLHRRINASRANFDYIKVEIPIKNAVDCQILFDIRDIAKVNRTAEFFIVSKDTDFDNAISDFRGHGLKVAKIPEICKPEAAVPPSTQPKTTVKIQTKNSAMTKREAQVRSFFGQHIQDKPYTTRKEEIIRAVLEAKTKQQLNVNLTKLYPSKTAGMLYQKLKPLMDSLPGQ